ncbi:MAG: sugar phosphate nucleotidyltransferase [Candidatus Binatia bacterium]
MQRRTEGKHWAVVLAGGEGTRLQELTRQITGSPIPKQYCRIMGERSMLETTLIRTQRYVPVDNTLVVINSTHLDIAREQLHPLPDGNILVQPCNRDTGPGLLFGLLALVRRDPAAIVGLFPSDHYVGDDRGFIDHVGHATRVVEEMPDKIVVLGIRPDHPEPGYGYIMPAGQYAGWSVSPSRRVRPCVPCREVPRKAAHPCGPKSSPPGRLVELLCDGFPASPNAGTHARCDGRGV